MERLIFGILRYFERIISRNDLLLSEAESHKNYEGQGGCYLLRLQGLR